MWRPHIRTGTGNTGLNTNVIASQFETIPRKKPVIGRNKSRLSPDKLLNAISWIMPHTKPMTAPQCSMKRNSASPSDWKKLLSNTLFSVKTLTNMPSLSKPFFLSLKISVNVVHRSGHVSMILSTAVSAIRRRDLSPSIARSVHGKCSAPTFARAPSRTLVSWGRVLATSFFGSTAPMMSRGPWMYGLAQVYPMEAILAALRGTTPCQPMPMPVPRYCHNPRKFSGRNII
mmetsp:Transcript_100724/g.307927  ORF Transcript_100724/g.307927 Transcript_100724/m.307927 type:complete len:230 (+) Transcript_100724:540-1229(+)